MANPDFDEFENGYYEHTRKEIFSLLPDTIDRILEIGCGEGKTLLWVKSIKNCKWVGGVELTREAALKAEKNLDKCYEGNIEIMDFPNNDNSMDVILCLDVLEHLIDPWSVIKKLHKILKPGGVIIASIPNVQHYTVSFPYIFKGEWNYDKAGILDKTHLRFFVKKTSCELMESSGLKIDRIKSLYGRKRSRLLSKILPEYFNRFLVYQYIIRAANIKD